MISFTRFYSNNQTITKAANLEKKQKRQNGPRDIFFLSTPQATGCPGAFPWRVSLLPRWALKAFPYWHASHVGSLIRHTFGPADSLTATAADPADTDA